MIGFAAPWVLLGLVAAGIPVLLHLFARREPPTVVFPATRYLAETARAHHRRLTFQHWLLLLIRTLLITALVLAAAGPSWPRGGVATHVPAALTVILDNSLSSGAVSGGTPVIEAHRAAARAIFGAARSEDVLWLITADAIPQRGSRETLTGIVDRLNPVPQRLDLGQAIGIARLAMAGERRPASTVVLTDLQASALSAAPGAGPVVVIRPEAAPVSNLGVSSVAPGRQPWGPEGGRVAVTLAGTPEKNGALTVRVGLRPPRQHLGTGGSTVSLASGVLPAGWWPVRVELEPDELRLDDVRETAVRVADAARAAWRAEDRFLATAAEVLLENHRLARGADLTLGALGPGASIVQPPADPAAVGALNRALAARGIGWRLGDLAPGSAFTDSGQILGRHPVSRRHQLIPAGTATPRGVLVTVAGAPWVVRSGEIILLGSRLEPDWLSLPLSAEFVPFVDFLANRAVRGELVLLDVAPGEPAALPDAATGIARQGRVRPVEGGSAFGSGETGLHFILAGRDTIGVLAVNPDPRESDLTRGSDADARRLWPESRVTTTAHAAAAAFASGGRADLRGVLLLLAGMLAVADALLAGAGARRSARSPA